MSLVERVQAFAGRHGLWTPDTRVVAAVSGGSDSVALAVILRELSRLGDLSLAGIAHLHHHIRTGDADTDASFVEQLAARLGAPVVIGHSDVPALAAASGHSTEVAGRQARLAFFDEVRDRLRGDVVALAHTRGDQAETVLLRLARGAGPRGLAGMSPRLGHRVRPLLEIGRDELRHWLESRGERWRDDETNADLANARNFLRHDVLPRLASLNPRVEEALARAARIQAADAALLDEWARREADRLIARVEGAVHLEVAALDRLPEALARRVVLRAFETLDPTRAYGWEETDAVLRRRTAAVRDVGRLRLERKDGVVVLRTRGAEGSGPVQAEWQDLALALDVPGSARHPAGWWVVSAEGPFPVTEAPASNPGCAVVDAAALGGRLRVRGWRPGDRVAPIGLGGRKKLQDLFVDRKVPRDERGMVAIVVNARDEVVWVAGHAVGEAFRVTPRSAGVVVLTLRR